MKYDRPKELFIALLLFNKGQVDLIPVQKRKSAPANYFVQNAPSKDVWHYNNARPVTLNHWFWTNQDASW